MKTKLSIPALRLLATLAVVVSSGLLNPMTAQNLIVNPGFSDGSVGWSTDCSIEIHAENVYGGTSSTNNVTEIDVERCLNQTANVSAGASYIFSYKASRRRDAATPATVGVTVTITGVESGIQYLNSSHVYTNTTWAYTTELFLFTLPVEAIDTRVNVKFSNYVTTGTYGTLIDDITLTTSSGTLPLKFLGFSGKLNDRTTRLTWTASNDDHTGSYFVVEQSIDQTHYDSIGVVKASFSTTTYSFNCNNASNEMRYYRIKAVNINGHSYSSIVRIERDVIPAAIKLYPNPATSKIFLSLTSAASTVATVQVYTMSGNVMMTKTIAIAEGTNSIGIDITSLNAGSFFLKVSDQNGLNIARTFAKQ